MNKNIMIKVSVTNTFVRFVLLDVETMRGVNSEFIVDSKLSASKVDRLLREEYGNGFTVTSITYDKVIYKVPLEVIKKHGVVNK